MAQEVIVCENPISVLWEVTPHAVGDAFQVKEDKDKDKDSYEEGGGEDV